VGVMIDFWDETVKKGVKIPVPVIAINDLEKAWSGMVVMRLKLDDKVVQEKNLSIMVPAFGKSEFGFSLEPVRTSGSYTLEVMLTGTPAGNISSIRHFKI